MPPPIIQTSKWSVRFGDPSDLHFWGEGCPPRVPQPKPLSVAGQGAPHARPLCVGGGGGFGKYASVPRPAFSRSTLLPALARADTPPPLPGPGAAVCQVSPEKG